MSTKYIILHLVAVLQYMSATYYNANYVVVPNTEEFKQFHAYGGLAKYLTLWNMQQNHRIFKMLRILVHLIGALQFSYSVYYDWNYVQVPIEVRGNGSTFGGKFIYLTFWNAVIQSVFFWICLINDFVGSNEVSLKSKPAIRGFKDILFCSIAFPLSAFVAITFWGLYAIDRELVLPKILDNYFPTWLNHIMHTNILIFTLIELISSFRVYPTRKQGLSILTSLMLVYLVWVFIIYSKSGQWVYPVMEILNWPQKILFFLVLFLVAHGFYLTGEFLNKVIWSQELNSVATASGRKLEKRKAH